MFIKEIQTKLGIPAKYWKLNRVTIDRNLLEASYEFALYFTPDATQFIESKVVSLLNMEDKTQYHEFFGNPKYDNIFISCHEHARQYDDFFKDAEYDSTNI